MPTNGRHVGHSSLGGQSGGDGMSTILDALRKVERERDPAAEHTLDAPSVAPDARRRRSFPIVAVLTCAVLGFTGGAMLSWWLPSAPPEVEVAALPVPPPPPAIAVPRAPLLAKPVAPTQPETDVGKAGEPASPPVAALPPPQQATPAQTEVVVAEKPAALAAVEASRPIVADTAPKELLASIDKQASALEPSPFSAPREAAPAEPANPAVSGGVRERGVRAVDPADDDIAALAPADGRLIEPPPVEVAPEDEPAPEPETPAETLVDTGRSPPGAPKVALSFLQWSADPARRFAFISIDGAPTQRVHEGEVAAGLTVAAITPTGVQFKREGTIFVIRPRH